MHADKDAIALEAALRRRQGWQQFVNTMALLAFVAAIVSVSAFFVLRSGAWQAKPAPEVPVTRRVPAAAAPVARRPAAPAAPSPVASAPAAVPAPAAVVPTPKPASPRAASPVAAAPYKLEAEAPMQAASTQAAPRARAAIRYMPSEASTEPAPARLGAAQSLAKFNGGPGAKRMLNSIMCFDDFSFDYAAGGREYFSALCKGGNRKQVSCAGSGCKIEYAPPPSHVQESR